MESSLRKVGIVGMFYRIKWIMVVYLIVDKNATKKFYLKS